MAVPSKPIRTQAAPALFRLLSDSSLSRAALGACGIPLALVNAAGPARAITYVNPAFTAYFGFGESEAPGRPLAALLLRGDESLANRLFADTAARWQVTAWSKDGTARPVEVALGAVRSADGHLSHWVLAFSDRSEAERLRAELESMKNLTVGSLALRLETPGQPARGAQQPRVEIPAADELHAERQPTRAPHQR
jgi:PAS domain S-box-containing protein